MKKNLKKASNLPEHFPKAFTSEVLLQQAIAGLLTRMPEISGVQILQGSLELGKDLVFYIPGGFGESVLCACVVKNSKITGDAGKVEGARTVFQQAQQAFDSPHIDAAGRDVQVERVYVVTPYDLSPATMHSIRGLLKERGGQVKFVHGPDLFDLFRQHWPDYFADEAKSIERHLNEVLRGFEDNNPLLGIAANYNVGTGQLNSKKVYVPQFFFRELRAYRPGVVLTKVFPYKEELQNPLKYYQVQQIITRAHRFWRALEFLQEWGYCTKEGMGRGRQNIRRMIDSFVEKLDLEWKTEAKIRHGTITKFELVHGVKINRPERLVDLLSQLEKRKALAEAVLQSELTNLATIVQDNSQSVIGTLADERYLAASALDSFTHAAPEDMFVPQNSARFAFPKNILERWQGNLLIVGAAGYGKTSFCRWHALKDAERFNSGKSKIIPVYVPLYRLSKTRVTSFSNAFLGSLGKSALLAGTSKKDIAQGRIRLYLDGLDEIASPAKRKQIIKLAEKGATPKKYQIVLTSRDYIHEPYLNWLPRVALGGFEESDVAALVRQWLGKDTEESEQFYDQLKDVPALKGLMRIPLLATLIILVFRQTRRLPESRTRLYQVFVELLSGGWDMAKRVLRPSRFGQRVKLIILRVLAANLHERQRREFGKDELIGAIRMSQSETVVPDWELLRNEFLEDGLVSSGGNVLQFSHLSFQEFLTAQNYIGDLNPTRINRALELFLNGSDWWKDVITFYVGLSGKPREMAKWLSSAMKNTNRPIKVSVYEQIIKGVRESYPEFPISEMVGSITTAAESQDEQPSDLQVSPVVQI